MFKIVTTRTRDETDKQVDQYVEFFDGAVIIRKTRVGQCSQLDHHTTMNGEYVGKVTLNMTGKDIDTLIEELILLREV